MCESDSAQQASGDPDLMIKPLAAMVDPQYLGIDTLQRLGSRSRFARRE
jgi:hypothetical protein